jgi:hypothetical protein
MGRLTPAGANGETSEAPMSAKGFADLKGNVKDLLGEGAGPFAHRAGCVAQFHAHEGSRLALPQTSRRCGLAEGQSVFPFVGSGWVDDARGFRPGYRFLCTLELRAFVKGDATQQALGKKTLAGDLLVRNIGGLKQNRLKAMGTSGVAGGAASSIVLAYDASPTYHSNETRELHEIAPGEKVELKYNFLYLDAHADERIFTGRDGFLQQFHGPCRAEVLRERISRPTFAEYFVFPPPKEK